MLNDKDPRLCAFERTIAEQLGLEDLDTLIGRTFTFESDPRDLVCTITSYSVSPFEDEDVESGFELMLLTDAERDLRFATYGDGRWTMTENPDTPEERIQFGSVKLWQ